jgi:hypothetical protein
MFTWIKQKIAGFFVGGYMNSVVRTLVKAAAGFLVLKGVIPAGAVEQFINANTEILVGLISLLLTQLWSWLDKKKDIETPAPVLPKV